MTTTEDSPDVKLLKADVLGRVRVKAGIREQILDDFERSGMSGRAFAKHHGIHAQTFASWIQKRRRERGDYEDETICRTLRMPKLAASLNGPALATPPTKAPKSTALSLIEVALPVTSGNLPGEARPRANEEALEVMLPGGVRVRITSKSQLGLLKALLKEVGPC